MLDTMPSKKQTAQSKSQPAEAEFALWVKIEANLPPDMALKIQEIQRKMRTVLTKKNIVLAALRLWIEEQEKILAAKQDV